MVLARWKGLMACSSAVLAIGLFSASQLVADDDDEPTRFAFALIGDQPYFPKVGTQQQFPTTSEYINIIDSINNSERRVAFTVHIGDIKAGDTFCSNDVYTNNLALFNRFARPLIYLPGDNEWTDCHRVNNRYHCSSVLTGRSPFAARRTACMCRHGPARTLNRK